MGRPDAPLPLDLVAHLQERLQARAAAAPWLCPGGGARPPSAGERRTATVKTPVRGSGASLRRNGWFEHGLSLAKADSAELPRIVVIGDGRLVELQDAWPGRSRPSRLRTSSPSPTATRFQPLTATMANVGGRGLLGREHGAHSGENLLRRPGPHVTFHLSWHQDQRWAVAPREVFTRYGTGFSSSLAPVTWAGRSRAAELSLGDGRADGTARARAGSGGVGDAAEHRAVGGVESRQRAASAAPTAAMCASIAARSWSALAISAALSGGPGWHRRRRVRFDGQTEQAG